MPMMALRETRLILGQDPASVFGRNFEPIRGDKIVPMNAVFLFEASGHIPATDPVRAFDHDPVGSELPPK